MGNKIITFGWVWVVCFLLSWGLMAFIKVADQHTDVSGWYLGLISVGFSFPIAALITVFLNIFRSSIEGTAYEKRLEKAKGLRIGTISVLVGFLGAGEAVAFGTGIGQVIFFLAFIGVVVAMGIHFYEIFSGNNA